MKKVCRRLVWIQAIGLIAVASRGDDSMPQRLTLQRAEEIALTNHPRITAAELKALAARQVIVEARAGFFPNVYASITAAGAADDNTRIAAGGLNNAAIFERNAEGLTISQLITDFGRTANLTASAKLRASAEHESVLATRAQILLQVKAAYFSGLQSRSVLSVAEQTLQTRQLLLDQVSALASNKLKSELDVSFAKVAVDEGKLLLIKSQNDLKAVFADLSALLGDREPQDFQLVEEPMPPAFSTNVSELVAEALRDRPELTRLRFERDAALKLAKAEKGLSYPTLSAIGGVGVIPVHDPRLAGNYAAAGVNLNLPLFSGGLLSARRKEAELRAKAAEQTLRDEENLAIREVRVAWLNANNALERARITEQLLLNANQAFNLAEARYRIGSSSIVELSQAQLNKTAAEIAQANAKYEYQIQRAVLDYQAGKIDQEQITPAKSQSQTK